MPRERSRVNVVRPLISGHCFGHDVRGGPKGRDTTHVNFLNTLEGVLSRVPDPNAQCHLKKMTNRAIEQHCRGELTDKHGLRATLLFTGNGEPDAPDTLLMVDVDAKRGPAPEQCREFLGLVRSAFPAMAGLFDEPSASGNSWHGYAVLAKRRVADARDGTPRYADAESVKRSFLALQGRLRRLLASAQAEGRFPDVTGVEIKGQPMKVEWGRDGRARVRCGILGKLPTTFLDRPEEFAGIARIPQAWLEEPEEPGVLPGPARPRRRALGAKDEEGKPAGGSSSNHPIPRGLLDRNLAFRRMAAGLMPGGPLPTAGQGRHVATAEDMAIFLMISGWITSGQDADRAMPSARIRGLWKALYAAGEVARPFCTSRVAALRDRVSRCGGIDWLDNRYWVTDRPDPGGVLPTRKGRCCLYSLDRTLMDELGLETPIPSPGPSGEPIRIFRPFVEAKKEDINGHTMSDGTGSDRSFRPRHGPVIRPIRVGWASQVARTAA